MRSSRANEWINIQEKIWLLLNVHVLFTLYDAAQYHSSQYGKNFKLSSEYVIS